MVSLSSLRTELDTVGPNTWSEHMPHTTKYKKCKRSAAGSPEALIEVEKFVAWIDLCVDMAT